MTDDNTTPDDGLLLAGEPPAFTLWWPARARPVLLVCDHAAPCIPARLADLGVPEAALRTHIAWDIGAAALAGQLARALDAAVVQTGYSRLVVDCNRHPDDPTLMPVQSDGISIPGNRNLSASGRAGRMAGLYWPYHRAIEAQLARLAGPDASPVLIAVHSFTPVMDGRQRPWHVGVLWDRDPRLALPLLAALRGDGDLVVGDNEPYSGRDPAGFTIDHHAQAHGLAHVSVEVRQDLLATTAGIATWAQRLAAALVPILALPGLYEPAADASYRALARQR